MRGVVGGQLKIECAAGAGTTLAVSFPDVPALGTRRASRKFRAGMRERSESVADEAKERASEDSGGGQIGTPAEPIDSVQEADEESFPASDAPSSWAGESRGAEVSG
jgi:hypothetical protein